MSPRTFLTVQEFLWYYYSAVCGSSAPWLYGVAKGNLFPRGLMPHAACPRSATARALVPVAGQGMTRTNTDILAISELKWTGMSIFNSDDQLYLLPWTRMPQKKWRSPHSQQKSPKCRTWMQSEKWQNDLCLFARQAIQCHSNPSHAPTINAEEAEVEQFYEDLQELIELTPKKKKMSFSS